MLLADVRGLARFDDARVLGYRSPRETVCGSPFVGLVHTTTGIWLPALERVSSADYEIDLSTPNIKESARKVKASGGGRRSRKTSTSDTGRSREQTQAVREWARQQGHSINDRGRIPASIQQAFDQAH